MQFPSRNPSSCTKTRTHKEEQVLVARCRLAFWAHPCHEVEVCSKKRSIRGKSYHGSIFRQPCRYYLEGTCTRSPCEYWNPPECQVYKNEMGCMDGEKCLFSHFKVDEQQTKKTEERLLPKKKRKRGERRCGYCENCVRIGLRLAKLGCVGFSKRHTVPVKPNAKKSWEQFKGNDSQSLRYVSRVSGTRKGPSQGKIQVDPQHHRSPHKIRGSVPLRDRKTRLHSTFPRRNGYSRLRQ